MDGCNGWMDVVVMDGRMDEWMGGWMDAGRDRELLDGWIVDVWIERWTPG